MQRYEISASVRIGAQASAQARRSTTPFDGSAKQEPSLPQTAESLALAFAACAPRNVKRFSRISRLRYESASIPVAAKERCDATTANPELSVASGGAQEGRRS